MGIDTGGDLAGVRGHLFVQKQIVEPLLGLGISISEEQVRNSTNWEIVLFSPGTEMYWPVQNKWLSGDFPPRQSLCLCCTHQPHNASNIFNIQLV